jgi:ADP-ribose pyrophosphatase
MPLSDPQVLLTSRKFRVERRAFETPTGTHHKDVVVHPGAAVILPVLPDGRLVLTYVQRPAVGAELLEVPAGTLDPGESPAACAARELSEETGYRAGRLTPLLTFYSSPGMLTERMHAFIATELTPGEPHPEETEQIRVAPMTLAEALSAIGDGRLCDAKSIAVLLYYERYVRSKGTPQ